MDEFGRAVETEERRREKRRAQQQQEKLQAKANKQGTGVVVQVTPDIPKVEGQYNRDNWKCVVDDESKLPREYLCPDRMKLDKAA